MEDFIDGLIGKPARKALEQVGHALMSGLPAGGIAYGLAALGVPVWASALVGVIVGVGGIPYVCGIAREVTQNWGDGRDEKTRWMIGKLPINDNMLLDIAFYSVGTAVLVPSALVLEWVLG